MPRARGGRENVLGNGMEPERAAGLKREHRLLKEQGGAYGGWRGDRKGGVRVEVGD